MLDDQPPPKEASEQQQQAQRQVQPVAAQEPYQWDGALLDRLRNQVAFYFSHQNLGRDKYLRNMLTSEHPEMPSPRPAQLMCPVGVITNFPKVKDICAQFQGREGQAPKPPALLLAKALEGSDSVTVSSDGNWIGPVLQQLPPLTMGGAPSAMGFQQPHHIQQQAPHLSYQQGSYQQPQSNHMPLMVPSGAHAMQYQPPGMPLHYPSPGHGAQYPNSAQGNTAPIISLGGSESPSSASLESMPSQQQQLVQQPQQVAISNDNVFVAVMDLPPSGAINPIEILSAFTTETIRPKSAFLDHHNSSLWHVSFGSEADAKAAILASAERTIAGMPVHAKLSSELPASASASLSSASAPGQILQQQQPVPAQSGVNYPLVPQGPSPPPPVSMGATPPPLGSTQSNVPLGYPPQYSMPPPQMQPPPQLGGMPLPGQPYPLHQPYYSPQQQMQQVYPGSYMPPQQQQGGPPPYQMLQHYPPMPQMGNRFGAMPPPPPPPRSGYPGGPPPPYPYSGMHEYSGGYGGHHYQQYGHPHPPPRQFNDRRQGAPGALGVGGGFHDQGQSRTIKKKKKTQQNQRRTMDTYGNISNDNNSGFRRSGEYVNYGQQRHDSSSSPTLGEHRGGLKAPWKQRRGENDQQFRRSYGNASPSFQRNYNKNHHNIDRTPGSDSAPSAGSSSDRQGKSDDREIFSSSDFPGLGGLRGEDKSEKSSQQGNNTVDGSNKQQLVGYASALLKKKEECDKKEADKTAPGVNSMDNDDVDSITRQTEEMERQILSEFHDLSLIGDGHNTTVALSSSPLPTKVNDSQGAQQTSEAATSSAVDDKTEGTASSSTFDASAKSYPNSANLPILPTEPFAQNEGSAGIAPQTDFFAEVLPKEQNPQPPTVDVTNTSNFPGREVTETADDGAVLPKDEIPPTTENNDAVTYAIEVAKPPGAWGSKRFADVI